MERPLAAADSGAVGHDEHFLSRLERLDREHAEIALGLYYDHGLVDYLLKHVALPDAAERVALSLDDPKEGPFVIVSRDGHFVTCLGRGMKLSGDRPVVTRHKLDQLSERVGGLRELIGEARSDRFASTKRMMRRIMNAADGMSREEFDDTARWMPLLGRHFVLGALHATNLNRSTWLRILRTRAAALPKCEELLRSYWDSTWALAHFATLLGTDRGESLAGAFAVLDAKAAWPAPKSDLFPGALVELTVTCFAARGAWITSRAPKLLFADLKRQYIEGGDARSTFSNALGLSAIGLRHSSYQAEVGKVLERMPRAAPDESDRAAFMRQIRVVLRKGLEMGIDNGDDLRDHLVRNARWLLAQLGARETRGGAAWLASMPDDAAVALFVSLPVPLFGEGLRGMLNVLEWLPWISRARASDFYLPERYVVTRRGPWKVTDALMLVKPRLDAERRKRQPAVAPPKPGRNERCPCASGSKYKRCCGATRRLSA